MMAQAYLHGDTLVVGDGLGIGGTDEKQRIVFEDKLREQVREGFGHTKEQQDIACKSISSHWCCRFFVDAQSNADTAAKSSLNDSKCEEEKEQTTTIDDKLLLAGSFSFSEFDWNFVT